MACLHSKYSVRNAQPWNKHFIVFQHQPSYMHSIYFNFFIFFTLIVVLYALSFELSLSKNFVNGICFFSAYFMHKIGNCCIFYFSLWNRFLHILHSHKSTHTIRLFVGSDLFVWRWFQWYFNLLLLWNCHLYAMIDDEKVLKCHFPIISFFFAFCQGFCLTSTHQESAVIVTHFD